MNKKPNFDEMLEKTHSLHESIMKALNENCELEARLKAIENICINNIESYKQIIMDLYSDGNEENKEEAAKIKAVINILEQIKRMVKND